MIYYGELFNNFSLQNALKNIQQQMANFRLLLNVSIIICWLI